MLEAIDEILIILPLFSFSILGIIDLIIKYIDLTFTSKEKSQSFSSQSRIVPWWTKPTALNSTSTFFIVFEKTLIALAFVESKV